jgi:hypothetical protein
MMELQGEQQKHASAVVHIYTHSGCMPYTGKLPGKPVQFLRRVINEHFVSAETNFTRRICLSPRLY